MSAINCRDETRICFAIDGTFADTYGGGQVYVRNLVSELCLRGHDITVLEIVRGESNAHPITCTEKHGIHLLRLHAPSGDTRGSCSQVETTLRMAILEARPDVVHAHGAKRLIARVCADLSVPCIVTAHHGGLVCPAGTLLDYEDTICRRAVSQTMCTHCCARQQPFGRLWSALLGWMPLVWHLAICHLSRWAPFIPYVTPALTIPLQVREKKQEMEELIAKACLTIAPSRAMQSALLINGWPSERVVFIPHGIPKIGRAEFPVHSTKAMVRFAYAGRLSRVKGLHVLIQAFNRLRGNVELHIIGKAHSKWEKRYWASLMKQVSRPERVIHHGHLTGPDYRSAVAACDVVILPSLLLEVFGLTVAEAFSLGRPVIVTNSGGPAEQMRNGENGIVVEPNNVVALAAAMQAFADDPGKARAMASSIREPVLIEQHVDALLELYSQCLTSESRLCQSDCSRPPF